MLEAINKMKQWLKCPIKENLIMTLIQIKKLFLSFGFAAFIITLIPSTVVKAQDYNKVIDVVKKLELSLKTLIKEEQKSREKEIALLREQFSHLLKNNAGAESKNVSGAHKEEKPDFTEFISLLKKGNERFVTGSLSKKEYDKERNSTAKSQHPYAIVLTCADSRLSPEIIFDESIGRLFVVRDAGNLVDSVILGSIEYAAEHLKAKLLIVLGHEACGAVKATIGGGEVPPNIGSIVSRLKPPVEKIKATGLKDDKLVSGCVEENVFYQMKQAVKQSHVLAELVEKGEFGIIGGVYDLGTGKVKFVTEGKNNLTNEKKESSHGH